MKIKGHQFGSHKFVCQWQNCIKLINTLKRKSFAPYGLISFFLKKTSFQKGLSEKDNKQEVTNLSPSDRIVKNLPSLYIPLKFSLFCYMREKRSYICFNEIYKICCMNLEFTSLHYQHIDIISFVS